MVQKTIRRRYDRENNFVSFFNTQNGFYVRSLVKADGKKLEMLKEGDAFQSSMPELIDIGVMGHCDRGCEMCYQNAQSDGKDMSLEDYRSILEQVKHDVFQVALGGAGNPDQHKDFVEIVRCSREDYNIVPSYTTNSLSISKEVLEATKKYCGAVAVSYCGAGKKGEKLGLLKTFIDAGVKTNIHFVIGRDTIDEAIELLKYPEKVLGEYYNKVNAIIFLLYKPMGRATEEGMLQNDGKLDLFVHMVEHKKHPFKIGFDSCCIPFILSKTKLNDEYMDTCEGGRYSCYISADMQFMPCSFAKHMQEYHVSLKEMTIREGWNSEQFEKFREPLRKGCPDCKLNSLCMGGCPLGSNIPICDEEERRK
jgi:radical SAM protein with 4Fe4S-binding SPASM domain